MWNEDSACSVVQFHHLYKLLWIGHLSLDQLASDLDLHCFEKTVKMFEKSQAQSAQLASYSLSYSFQTVLCCL